LENSKEEVQKNAVSIVGVGEVRLKGQGGMRSDYYKIYISGGERAEHGVEIVVHKILVTSVVKKTVCNGRTIAVQSQAKPVRVVIVQVLCPHQSMKMTKWKNCGV
jgi:hypothetical protein